MTPTPTEPIRGLIREFYNVILDRSPEAGAVDASHHGYFDYAINFNIDVRFIPREMARQFFLSAEYRNRNRTREEFIRDNYNAFLNRSPSNEELNTWLAGQWDRARVMTLFSESPEFAQRIQNMYPGRQGDPTRNFVTTMYIGLLDRLVDSEGLAYFAGEFNAAPNKRQRSIQMAEEVMASTEFQNNTTTPSQHVVRFYRAFLGRFPSQEEENYWVNEINSGRETYSSLIREFADSPEFTARLNQYFGTT